MEEEMVFIIGSLNLSKSEAMEVIMVHRTFLFLIYMTLQCKLFECPNRNLHTLQWKKWAFFTPYLWGFVTCIKGKLPFMSTF